MIPDSTYRVQMSPEFDFDEAASVVDYLADLGITHLYSSPILQATPGSSHGYDVTDPGRVSSELGDIQGLERLRENLEHAGMGQIIDIVPNHMAAHPSNPWWWDVLARGRSSPYATYFDIQWQGDEGGGSDFKILVPILGDHYGRVLESGAIELQSEDGDIVLTYEEHRLPLSPESKEQLVAEAGAGDIRSELAEINADPDRLDGVIETQSYRLAYWKTANEELDYRRFFNIETLVGLRVESTRVFEETHQLVIRLIDEGIVDGLRIDHVDGLRDPFTYLSRLTEATNTTYTVVEKILEPEEGLPAKWPVAGTTGYDFLNRVNALYVDTDAEAAFSNLYRSFTGEAGEYAQIVHEAKLELMETQLATEMHRLTGLLSRICHRHRRHRDHTRRDLRRTLSQVIAGYDVYRTYVRPGEPPAPTDRVQIKEAIARARSRRPDLDAELLELIRRLGLGLDAGPLETEFCVRLQQFTAPVMAKGVEDTAFYRYNRFVTLNEVGGDPDTFGIGPARFHEETADAAADWPHSMLTLSTHDTKRSADVRARLNVLSELPVEWRSAVEAWAAHNERHRTGPWPDRNTEYLLYQTLVGTWPIAVDRAVRFMEKATREAKTLTSWVEPNLEYEEAVGRFVTAILADHDFVDLVGDFLGQNDIVTRGFRNSLSQLGLLLTSPGVPDIYQGSEVWDLSLVDPDNRRPVDYEERRRLLELVIDADRSEASNLPGGPKLWLTHRLLQHRRNHRDVYSSSAYEPLRVEAGPPRGALAFRRGPVVALASTRSSGDHKDTSLELPAGRWANVLSGRSFRGGRADVNEILGGFPFAVMEDTS